MSGVSGVSGGGGFYVYDPASKRLVPEGYAAQHGSPYGHGAGPMSAYGGAAGHGSGGLVGSVGRSTGNFVKGATVGFAKDLVKGAFLDEQGHFSLKKTLVSGGLVLGAGALIAAAPVAGLALGAAAVGMAAPKVINNASDMVQAYSRGDYHGAEQSAYNLGSSTTSLGVSALGTTASLKAVQASKGITTTETATSLLKPSNLKSTASEVVKELKPSSGNWTKLSEAWQSAKNTFKPATAEATTAEAAGKAASVTEKASAAFNSAKQALGKGNVTNTAKNIYNNGKEFYGKPFYGQNPYLVAAPLASIRKDEGIPHGYYPPGMYGMPGQYPQPGGEAMERWL